jgi:hypothetical protein
MQPTEARMHPADTWLHLTRDQEHFLKSVLLQEANLLGPSVALLVQALWADSIVETAREVYQLLRLPRRYGAQRLEAACKRAAYYRRERNSFTIEWLLQEGYDELPLTPYTDIRGQWAFAFDDPNDEKPCGQQPSNPEASGVGIGGQRSAQSRKACKSQPEYCET